MPVKDYSTTPASNATVGSITFAEGQVPSTLNDSNRQLMADLAELFALNKGGMTTGTVGGTGETMTLATTPNPFQAAYALGQRFLVKAPGANTSSAPTINVATLGAKTIKTNGLALPVPAYLTNDMLLMAYDGTDMQLVSATRPVYPRNAQTGTTYTVVEADRGDHITLTNAAAIAVTLPQSTSSAFVSGFYTTLENIGSTTVTITPTISTINGSSSLVLLSGQYALITAGGTNYRALVGTSASITARYPLNYLGGLELARASTTTYTVAKGACCNEDAGTQRDMVLASTFTKSLSAWAVGSGNGSLDTGAIAATSWYHVHLIRRDLDSQIDVLLSLSATAPTMPSGFTARRRVGSIRTDGSSQIVSFIQTCDEFTWLVPVLDVNVTNPGTAATSRTLTVPTGVKVKARLRAEALTVAGTAPHLAIYSPDITDQVPHLLGAATASLVLPSVKGAFNAAEWGSGSIDVMTNTSAQVRTVVSVSAAGTIFAIQTDGWIDTRGK